MPDKAPIEGTDDDQRYTLTARECLATQLLYRDGWDRSVLAMVFEITENNLWHHINGECGHRYDHVDLPADLDD